MAADQHLLEPGSGLDERRRAFLRELRGILTDMDRLQVISVQQFIEREAVARTGPAASRSSAAQYANRVNVPASRRRTAVWPLLLGVALLAGCTAAGLAIVSAAEALTATGLPDPGPVTTIGLPFIRAAGEIAAVIAIGSFMFAAFFVPPQESGVLDAAGYRALRTGTLASGAWAVCAALLVPLTISDVSGQPLRDHLSPASMWSVAERGGHCRGMAVDGITCRRGDLGEHPGTAVVVDAGAVRGRAGDAATAGADRALVGRRGHTTWPPTAC